MIQSHAIASSQPKVYRAATKLLVGQSLQSVNTNREEIGTSQPTTSASQGAAAAFVNRRALGHKKIQPNRPNLYTAVARLAKG